MQFGLISVLVEIDATIFIEKVKYRLMVNKERNVKLVRESELVKITIMVSRVSITLLTKGGFSLDSRI